jgi:hypothetical protein
MNESERLQIRRLAYEVGAEPARPLYPAPGHAARQRRRRFDSVSLVVGAVAMSGVGALAHAWWVGVR